jgi:hypothetical protein
VSLNNKRTTYATHMALGVYRNVGRISRCITQPQMFATPKLFALCEGIRDSGLAFVGLTRLRYFALTHYQYKVFPTWFSVHGIEVCVDILPGDDGVCRMLLMLRDEGPDQPPNFIPF